MRSNSVVLIVIGVVVMVGLLLAANLGGSPSAGWGGGTVNSAALQNEMADFQTRQMYLRTMSDMQQMQHDTAMTIIHNMGNGACRIGVDPNCQ